MPLRGVEEREWRGKGTPGSRVCSTVRATSTVLSFAVVGVLGGLSAALLFGPSAVFLVVPPTTILCALLGAVVARSRLGWALTIPLVPVAGVANGALLALLVNQHVLREGAQLGFFFSLPFALGLPFVALAASRMPGRPRSLAATMVRVRLAAVTLLAGGILFLPHAFGRTAVPFAYGCEPPLGVLAGLPFVATAVFVRGLLVHLRLAEAVRTVPLLRATVGGRSELRDRSFVDLGLGDTQHVYVDSATLLRGAPSVCVMYEGDVDAVGRLVRSALACSAAAAAVTWLLVVLALVRIG